LGVLWEKFSFLPKRPILGGYTKFTKQMIQRIQTIYLVLAGAAAFGAIAAPFANISSSNVQTSALFADDAAFTAGDNTVLMVIFTVAGALAIASIFLYNNRPLQVKTGWAALVANFAALAFGGFLFGQDMGRVGDASVGAGFGVALPFVFIVFCILAIKGIRKDEALVRSADRLR
jgi:hypothetical protein